jgi:hypothetical protein
VDQKENRTLTERKMISMEYSSKCIKANIGIIQDHDIKPLKSSLKTQTGRPKLL